MKQLRLFYIFHKPIADSFELKFIYSEKATKVRGRFRKILWPSQNIWTLIFRCFMAYQLLTLSFLKKMTAKNCLAVKNWIIKVTSFWLIPLMFYFKKNLDVIYHFLLMWKTRVWCAILEVYQKERGPDSIMLGLVQ